MSEYAEWWVWPLAAAVAALFIWYFWHTGRTMVEFMVSLVRMIQNWPQTRRAMVEAEARSPGGRYPFWYRAIRVLLVITMAGFAGYLVYRGFH